LLSTGKQKVVIGEDVSERLDVVPAKFRVIVTRRPKYAFKNADGVIQAPAPAHIIEGGIPTEALLARSRSPNTPMACRSTGTRRSTRAIMSSSTAS
jgi:transposase